MYHSPLLANPLKYNVFNIFSNRPSILVWFLHGITKSNKEDHMEEKNVRENRFDLDIGYITKSPCRECPTNNSLPECSSCCEVLAQLQELLVGTISCSKKFLEFEEYHIWPKDDRELLELDLHFFPPWYTDKQKVGIVIDPNSSNWIKHLHIRCLFPCFK